MIHFWLFFRGWLLVLETLELLERNNLMIISLLDLSRTPKPIWRTVSHFGETHCQGRRTPERDHHDNFFKPGPVAASLDICTESYSHMANGLPLWGDAMPGKETPSKQQRCIISLLDLYRTPDLMWRTVSPEGWHSAREGNAGTRWYKTFKIDCEPLLGGVREIFFWSTVGNPIQATRQNRFCESLWQVLNWAP